MTNTDIIGVEAEQGVVRTKSRRKRVLLSIVLVILVILLAVVSVILFQLITPSGQIASGEDAGDLIWVRSIYGWGPTVDQQLTNPGSLAVGPDGTIWVTEAERGVIVGFNPDGSLSAIVDGGSESALNNPTDIGVDPQGLLYVAENPLNQVHVIDPVANEVLLTIPVPAPSTVTATDERIYVGSNAGFAILDKEGTPLNVLGTRGKEDDQFDMVNGITVGDDGTIYVTDTFNNRISAYDQEGRRLWMVVTGNPGNKTELQGAESMVVTTTAEAALQLPAEITFDGNNRLVVVDPWDITLTVLDPADGSLIAKYGRHGSVDGQMLYPAGVDYDPQRDWFAVADTGNMRVQIFRMPDSGGSPLADIRRSLTGPLRACLAPLVLLLIALIVAVIRRRRRRKAALSTQGSSAPAE